MQGDYGFEQRMKIANHVYKLAGYGEMGTAPGGARIGLKDAFDVLDQAGDRDIQERRLDLQGQQFEYGQFKDARDAASGDREFGLDVAGHDLDRQQHAFAVAQFNEKLTKKDRDSSGGKAIDAVNEIRKQVLIGDLDEDDSDELISETLGSALRRNRGTSSPVTEELWNMALVHEFRRNDGSLGGWFSPDLARSPYFRPFDYLALNNKGNRIAVRVPGRGGQTFDEKMTVREMAQVFGEDAVGQLVERLKAKGNRY